MESPTPTKLPKKELIEKYLSAEKDVEKDRVIVPEELKMTIYALAKQIREGDCNKPKPPA